MKRAFILFLALLYMVFSTGFTTYTHLCNGVGQQTSLTQKTDMQPGTCQYCNANKTSNHSKQCCKQEQKVYKLEEKSPLFKQLDFNYKEAGNGLIYRFLEHAFNAMLSSEEQSVPSLMPSYYPQLSNPRCIIFCVFRI